MTHIDSDFLARSRAAFQTDAPPTLADIVTEVKGDVALSPIRKRDMLSALRRVEELFGKSLTNLPARPATVRELFQNASAVGLGISEKTLANIRTLVAQVVRSYAPPATQLTRWIPAAPAWKALLECLEVEYQRQNLYRLATYCTVMNIPPCLVGRDTLVGLFEALVAEEAIKDPRRVLKGTILSWNRAVRSIPDWPQVTLSSPFKSEPWTMPLDAFPQSLQDEIGAWSAAMLNPDPLDDDAPPKALRFETVKARKLGFRKFATALVRGGVAKPEDITSIAAMLAESRFKAGLRLLLERAGNKKSQNLHNLANNLCHIAKHHCRIEATVLSEMEKLCRRLDPGGRHRLTDKNRERLLQFEDRRLVARLLTLPEQEARYAAKQKNPLRAAKAMERALALALLLHCGLRLTSLRTLELSDFHGIGSGRCILYVPAEKMKANRAHELELVPEAEKLLNRFVDEHRPLPPDAQGPFLFPGRDGGARSKNAMYEAVVAATRRAGLVMNPHMFRHAIGKIVVERDPGAYLAVSRVLGHRCLDTTTAHYLGTESKAAGRHLDSTLQAAREGR